MNMLRCPRSDMTFSIDGVGNLQPVGGDEFFEDVNDLVKPAAVGAGGPPGREGIGKHAGRRSRRWREPVPALERGPGGVRGWAREGETALTRFGRPRWGAFSSGWCTMRGVPPRGGNNEGGVCSARARSRRCTPRGSLPICSRRTRTAWLSTIILTVLAMRRTVLAITMAIMRRRSTRCCAAAMAYIWPFRGTPIYTQLIFWSLPPTPTRRRRLAFRSWVRMFAGSISFRYGHYFTPFWMAFWSN